MPGPDDEISFRLRTRADQTRNRAWLVIQMSVGNSITMEMVPNSVATRSVITPTTYRRLRGADLIGLDVFDFHTGRVTSVLRNVSIGNRQAPDLTVQIRDVPELLAGDGQYLVDGYLGLDYLFFGDFGSIEINTRTLRVALRVDR
jgi:hypothetical protein